MRPSKRPAPRVLSRAPPGAASLLSLAAPRRAHVAAMSSGASSPSRSRSAVYASSPISPPNSDAPWFRDESLT